MAFADENGISGSEGLLEVYMQDVYNEVWETKDLKRIKIKDMETSHIINSVKMIVKSIHNKRYWRVEYLPALIKQLKKRNVEYKSLIK